METQSGVGGYCSVEETQTVSCHLVSAVQIRGRNRGFSFAANPDGDPPPSEATTSRLRGGGHEKRLTDKRAGARPAENRHPTSWLKPFLVQSAHCRGVTHLTQVRSSEPCGASTFLRASPRPPKWRNQPSSWALRNPQHGTIEGALHKSRLQPRPERLDWRQPLQLWKTRNLGTSFLPLRYAYTQVCEVRRAGLGAHAQARISQPGGGCWRLPVVPGRQACRGQDDGLAPSWQRPSSSQAC